MVYPAVMGLFDKRLERFCEYLVVVWTAEDPFFAKLVERKAAGRAGGLLLGGVGELIVGRLDGEQAAEQLVYRDMAPVGNSLLGGALLADVHLSPNTLGDSGQVNSR